MKASKTLEVVIGEGLSIATAELPAGYVGVEYSVQCVAVGGIAPYRWSASNLPEGLVIDENGLVSGVPVVAGTFTPTVEVEDSL